MESVAVILAVVPTVAALPDLETAMAAGDDGVSEAGLAAKRRAVRCGGRIRGGHSDGTGHRESHEQDETRPHWPVCTPAARTLTAVANRSRSSDRRVRNALRLDISRRFRARTTLAALIAFLVALGLGLAVEIGREGNDA
jgi:hypothetical protein